MGFHCLISSMFLFGELIKSPFIYLLVSYFRADHLTVHPSIHLASYFCVVHSLGELFSCRPFNSPSFGEFFYADHITRHLSIVLERYFCEVHPLGELFTCRPFNCPICLSLWRVSFCVVHPLGRVFPCRPFNSPSLMSTI